MYQFILDANGFLWGTFGVAILILIFGIYATIRLRVPWVRHFKDIIRAFKGKALGKGVTPLQDRLCRRRRAGRHRQPHRRFHGDRLRRPGRAVLDVGHGTARHEHHHGRDAAGPAL